MGTGDGARTGGGAVIRDLWRRLRTRPGVALGAGSATLLLLMLLATGHDAAGGWATARPLGIDWAGWAGAVALLAAGLAWQIVLDGRDSIARQRRLAASSAQLRRASAELEHLAQTDTLTGLANRRLFHERFGEEFRRAQRYDRDLSLLMLDLDHFKRVNDAHGHQFGDVVLRVFADVMRDNVRESDLVARYGGEEFVVLLAETGQQAALQVAEKLRRATAETRFTDGATVERVTVSIGVAGLRECGAADEDALVRAADTALYVAKRGGRDRVVGTPAGDATSSASTPA